MKVFVSSTFEDLIDHRHAVDEIIGRLSMQFRGMELFGSRPFEPKKVCVDEIAACDLFLGVYAHRYGWVPEGDTLSITEQEFDEAKRLGKPCYCYVVDVDYPWSPKHIEFPALEKVKRFHAKVGTLVRSKFTTPDNLSKQVAADLNSAIAGRLPSRNLTDLLAYLRSCVAQEIATGVGTKYVRDLYVGRALDRSLKLRLQQSARAKVALMQLSESLRTLAGATEKRLTKRESNASFVSTVQLLADAQMKVDEFTRLAPSSHGLNYPAEDLSKELGRIKIAVSNLEAYLFVPEGIDQTGRSAEKTKNELTENRFLSNALQSTVASLAEMNQVLKPVYLVVDRAGGGKTNLLCHLAEECSQTMPTFFVAAKSIPEASEDAIMRYLASVYPISTDPILESLAYFTNPDLHCVVIIDGINEHFQPQLLNNALKSVVRRYYHKPVKFLLSCRDIYWRYFEDDWWVAHGGFISRQALTTFTRVEYRTALPLYLKAFDIEVEPHGSARQQLRHPLLLRFFCEAYRGTPTSPTRIGPLFDIRLLELFDAYCDRKFEQIRARLALIDADEIFRFVKMIALTMLEAKHRTLPVGAVARRAREDFGENSIRTADSRYVRILDEDILIEERPLGNLSESAVSFVYDEFMEYMIARSLWSDSVVPNEDPVGPIVAVTKRILTKEQQFISVFGVMLYLGAMLARISESYLLRYMDELIAAGMPLQTCDLAVRISEVKARPAIFERVLVLHETGSRAVRHYAWSSIEQMAPFYWSLVLSHLTSPGRPISGQIVFTLLRHVFEKLRPAEMLQALELIRAAFSPGNTRIVLRNNIDRATGINTAKRIGAAGGGIWTGDEQHTAARWLSEIDGQPG